MKIFGENLRHFCRCDRLPQDHKLIERHADVIWIAFFVISLKNLRYTALFVGDDRGIISVREVGG